MMNSTGGIWRNQGVNLPEAAFLHEIAETSQEAINIQSRPAILEFGAGEKKTNFADYKAYYNSLGADFESLARLQSLIAEGDTQINTLYCFRSVSRAIPEMVINIPEEEGKEAEAAAELAARRAEINKELAKVLRPEIVKIMGLMRYVSTAMDAFHETILRVASSNEKAPIVPEDLYMALLKLLDVLCKIDNMKDMKASLRSDFSRYKRAVGSNLSTEALEEMRAIQDFLSNMDPRKSKNAIVLTLRDRLQNIRNSDVLLTELVEIALDRLDNYAFLLPDERLGYIRVAAHLMVLIDGDPNDPKSVNVFSSKWPKQSAMQKLFRRFPVVPLSGDMTITLFYILDRAPHFNREVMSEAWGGLSAGAVSIPTASAGYGGGSSAGTAATSLSAGAPSSSSSSSSTASTHSSLVRVPSEYDLCVQWPAIRLAFTQYSVLLAAGINYAEAHPFRRWLDDSSMQTARDTYALCLKGFSLISLWTSTIQLALAWKYTHPSPRRSGTGTGTGNSSGISSSGTHNESFNTTGSSSSNAINTASATAAATATASAATTGTAGEGPVAESGGTKSGNTTSGTAPASANTSQSNVLTAAAAGSSINAASNIPDGQEYSQVIRFNFSTEELTVLADIISLIKSTTAMLRRAETVLAASIRFHMHHQIQQIVQGDLLPLLHRLDKRKKSELPWLLQIRTVAADWLKGNEPMDGNDYKQYSRQRGSITAVHPVRVVSASDAQLLVLREMIRTLFHERSPLRLKSGLFGKADLEKDDEKNFAAFFSESESYHHLLDFSNTLSVISNVGFLWYREFHLEITKCVQFPIEMSLPWILTEHLISNHIGNVPLMENILYTMDVYNDAANSALRYFKRQFLYEEIEAEANLVLDQLIFLIADKAYSYFKNFTASRLLDGAFRGRMEELKGSNYLTVHYQKYSSLITQRHVALLGRSVNLSYPVAQQFINKMVLDIDTAIARFESSDPSAIVELSGLLEILRETHATASQQLELESFDSLFHDVNETYSNPVYSSGGDGAPGTSLGRITTHMLRAICRDLVQNFSYNAYTCRFVRSPISIHPLEYNKPPKTHTLVAAYGSVCFRAYEMQGKLTRGFFGRQHIEAYLSLVGRGYADFEVIAEECMNDIRLTLEDVSAYAGALIGGIPPCKPPKFMFRAGGCYGYYEGKLRPLLEFDDLKPGVFQAFRELGNGLALLKDFSEAMDVFDQMRRVSLATLLGLGPLGVLPATSYVTFSGGNYNSSHGHSHSNSRICSGLSGLSGYSSSVCSRSSEANITAINATPVYQVLTKFASSMTAAPSATAVESPTPPCTTSSIMGEIPSLAHSLGNTLWSLALLSGNSLFRNVLLRLKGLVVDVDLLRSLRSSHDARQSEPGSIEVEHSLEFHRLWSALSFLFCVHDSSSESTADPSPGGDNNPSTLSFSDEEEFGHGFTLAGSLLLHYLGQRAQFELLDVSRHVLKVHRHEVQGAAEHSTQASMVGKVDREMQMETDKFVASAVAQVYLQQQFLQFFESQARFPMSLPPPTVTSESTTAQIVEQSSNSSLAAQNAGSSGRCILFRPPSATV